MELINKNNPNNNLWRIFMSIGIRKITGESLS